MPQPLHEQLDAINSELFRLLEQTRRSRAGQRDFNVELVRKLSAVVTEAEPLVRNARQMRSEIPAFADPLVTYLRLAADLQSELDKVNIMLLSQRSSLESARTQLHAASQFVDALSATR